MSLFNTSGKGAFSFGTTSTTKATGAAAPFSFGGSSGFSLGGNQLTTTSAGTSGLKFGSSTTSAAQSTSSFGSGFKFGSTPASSSATGLNKGFSLTGSAGLLTASTTTSVLSSSQATSSAPAFKGLGGTSSVANSSNQNGNGNKVNGVSQALKDEQVPEELCKDVQQFA